MNYFNLKKANFLVVLVTLVLSNHTHCLAIDLPGEDRIAFVIGNAAYSKPADLRNSVNDANSINEELLKYKFETQLVKDFKVTDIQDLRFNIEKRIKHNSVVFFYYAGHGIQVEGRNYLPAVDVNLLNSDLKEISDHSLYLGDVLHAIERAKPRLAVVILDACRDNPFKDQMTLNKNYKTGLARVDAPTSTVIFYATRPGGTASDGSSKNGLFTQALLNELSKPDQPIEVVMRRVAKDVYDQSKGDQEPWVEGVIRDELIIGQLPQTSQLHILEASNTISNEPNTYKISNNDDSKIQQQNVVMLDMNSTYPQAANSAQAPSVEGIPYVEALKNLNDIVQKNSNEIKTIYQCEDEMCYPYANWAKSLNQDENLNKLKENLAKITDKTKLRFCEFDLNNNACKSDGLRVFSLSPIVFIPGAQGATVLSLNINESKVSKSGGLSFNGKPDIKGVFGVHPLCSNVDGQIDFSLDKINLAITRTICVKLNVVTGKFNFDVIQFDSKKNEYLVKWNGSQLGLGVIGGGSGVAKITF